MAFGNEKCKEIVENICPYCGEVLMMNKRSFANHVRWCKKNPRYSEIKESCISKLKSKPSKQKTYICQCEVCGKEYEVQCTEYIYKLGKYRKTCCDNCAKQLTVNNTDNKLKNKKISEAFQQKPSYKKHIIRTCKYCGVQFETHSHNRIFCSCLCSNRYRKLGGCKDINDKKLKSIYKSSCQFNFALNSYPGEFDFSLIEKYGWYKAKNRGNNLNGVSRDHIYSRDKGFENLIDPYIISHPANCQLLRHNDNMSKNSDCDIELESLIEKIKKWNQKYGEYPNTIDYKLFESLGINFQKFEMIVKE